MSRIKPIVKPDDADLDCTLFRELQLFLRTNFPFLTGAKAHDLAVKFLVHWKIEIE